jgi:hypothetical protein
MINVNARMRDWLVGGVLGKALRCSPQKESGKRMTIPSDDLGARRGLNFSGDQRRRAMSAASSSAGQRNRDDQVHKRRRYREEEREAGDATFGAHMGIPIEISEELVAGVKKMGMDHVLPDLNQQPLPASPERVSGMNSFVDSSGALGRSATETASASHLSMRDRLLLAKNSREGVVGVKKNEVEVKVADKETDKQKRSKKATHANIAASIKELEKRGLDTEVNQISVKQHLSQPEPWNCLNGIELVVRMLSHTLSLFPYCNYSHASRISRNRRELPE